MDNRGDCFNLKKKKYNFILFFAILLFSIVFINAGCPEGDGYLGNKEYGECIRISQTCASCSYVNISSITLSTINSTLASNIEMTNFGNGEWTYQFCNTSHYGSYFIQGKGDLDGIDTNFKSCFDIGQNLSTSESIIYSVFMGILFLLFLVVCYFIIILPGENEKNNNGVVIGIIKLKYIRIFLIALCYPILLIILNLITGLAVNFSSLEMFANIFGFIYQLMFKVSWVFTILIIIWIFYMLVQDSNFKDRINKLGRFRVNG